MSTSKVISVSQMTVDGISVQIVRKPIKHLHLGVYPPNGHVRVAAPRHVDDDNMRLFVVSRLSWIKKHQAVFQAQPRQFQRRMVSGESHYVWGQRYRLEVIEHRGHHQVAIENNMTLQLRITPGTSTEKRTRVLTEWYREQLKAQIPGLLSHWQPLIGQAVSAWGVKKMKTKWGSCNISDRRIWLNLELAKKPMECLEYVLVHELVHLLERYHNDRFKAYMDQYLPRWHHCHDLLRRDPLWHENWD